MDSDSGIYGPKYNDQLLHLQTLQKSYKDISEIADYGKSVRGRTLRMLIVDKQKSATTSRPAVLITGSIHGNEYLSIADRLPESLLKASDLYGSINQYVMKGGVVMFVPIVNPDGYEARKRHNAKGADLNRDWDVPPAGHKGFKQVETRLLANHIESIVTKRNLRLKVAVEYHCCIGALLYPWSYTRKPIPTPDLTKHKQIGKLADPFLNIAVGTTPQILGYTPLGTAKDYYYAKYKALAFTYEGRRKNEKAYLKEHVQWWEEILDTL